MRSEPTVARHYVVHGRVQGVGFRFFVERSAQRLGLAGYVKNRADGTVEVYALGPRAKLDTLNQELWSGPRWAQVDDVEEREAQLRPSSTFRIES